MSKINININIDPAAVCGIGSYGYCYCCYSCSIAKYVFVAFLANWQSLPHARGQSHAADKDVNVAPAMLALAPSYGLVLTSP